MSVKIHPRVTTVDESGKKIKIKTRGLIFHLFRQALPYTADWNKFGLRVRLVDVINCAKFYRNQLRCFDFVGEGSKFDHSHWIAISPLTLLELPFRCDIDNGSSVFCVLRDA